MALKIRRGTDAQRSGVTFDQGEIVWTTDAQKLWIGDGVTQGGVPVVGSSVVDEISIVFNGITKRLELGTVYTDDITESPTAIKKFFTQELAQDAAALLFTTGIHSGITVQYDDQNGRINLTVDPDDIGITDVVNDTTPQLGGNLDLNTHDITGVGDIDISGNVNAIALKTATLTVENNSIRSSNNTLTLGTVSTPLDVTVYPNDRLFVKGTTGTGFGGAFVTLQQQRGTFSVPTSINPGDTLGGLEFKPYTGTKYVDGGLVGFRQDENIPYVPGNDFIATVFTVVPTTASGFIDFVDGSLLTFNSKSVLATKIIKSNGLTTTQRNALTPEPGMMIYNSTTKKFQGYTDDAGSGSPGWVDFH